MRTYSHALLTYAATRRIGSRTAVWAALGATLPDLPAGVGAAWLGARRLKRFSRAEFDAQVCGRKLFCGPDAALHSALPATAALVLGGTLYHKRAIGRAPLALLLGWAGHILADTLTHGRDARPILWPLSALRLESPVSYREHERHARAFTLAEHSALLLVAMRLLARERRSR